jgi:Protein of unknown function (DUF2442)
VNPYDHTSRSRASDSDEIASLLDERFIEQVFIDGGAVAWPGEIDMAPDAMYEQVATERRRFRR